MSGGHPEVPAGSIVLLPEGAKILNDRGRARRIAVEYSFVTKSHSGEYDEFIFWAGTRGVRNRVKKAACRIFAPAGVKIKEK